MAGKLKIEVKRQDFYRLSRLDDADKLVGPPKSGSANDANLRTWSAWIGAPVEWIDDRIADVLNGAPGPFDIPSAATATPQPSFRLRGRLQPDTEAITADTFEDALATIPTADEPLISWRGTDAIACLDVDFHEFDLHERPTPGEFLQFAEAWHPRPAFAWSSHGRGFHAVFLAADGWPAEELAAVAAMPVAKRFPGASFEIKRETRHPAVAVDGRTCGPVHRFPPDPDPVRYLRELMRHGSAASTVTSADPTVKEWLADKGLVVGQRYAHDRCPIDPSKHGKRDPVVVYPDAVYCHTCRAKGGRFMLKFADLVSEGIPSDAAELARHWVHWSHAKHVLAGRFDLSGPIAKLAYRVALKIHHEAEDKDPRLAAAMDDENEMLRFDGFWATRHGEALAKELPALLAGLPACQTDEGTASARRIARFSQTAGLEDFGYRAITPIWGCKIGTQFNLPRDPDAPHVVCYPTELRASNINRRPRYLRAEDRMSTADAWREIEKPFPGVPRSYIELLIAAKGCAEMGREKPPALYVSGPSGAGKTSSVMIAAAICGDVCTDVVWSPQAERFRQGVMSAAAVGTFCAINEAVKNGRVHHQTPVDVMDVMLNLTERSVSHKLYIGSVPLGRLPIFVWTETDLPEDLRHDKQLARRLVWVELSSQVRWEETQLAHCVDKPDRVRIASREYADACDAILSDVIDRYFRVVHTFEDIAKHLGFRPMQAAAEASSSGELRDFYAAVMSSPVLPTGHQGAGWVNIDLSADTKLATIWRGLSDADGLGSRKCAAEDWGKLLGSSSPVKFEVRRNGRSVAVRFSGNVVANPVQLEPGPVADGVDRPGDAERGGHPAWLAGLPAASFLAADVPRGEDGAAVDRVDPAGSVAG